jgi:cAMP phosphodiesterase
MKVKVGGCYGSETAGLHTVGFLIDDKLLLEGGTVTSAYSMDEQKAVENIIISHIHLDHTKELFFLLDNLASLDSSKVTMCGVREIIEGIKKHLFNEELWPDFSRLPTEGDPVLRFSVIPEGVFSPISGMEVKPVAVNHPVPATGYIIRTSESAIVYTGDTGPTTTIWEELKKEENLKAIIVETSFPDSMERLAHISGHLTPRLLAEELAKVGRPEVPVFIFHMKPLYLEEIRKELGMMEAYRIEILQQGQVYTF